MRSSFPSSGYAVISLQLNTKTIEELLAEAKKRTYRPVFRVVGGANDDPFRSQSRVTRLSATLRLVKQAIQEDASVRDENYTSCVFSYMHSQDGGEDQEPHQDYTAEVRAAVSAGYPGTVPASVIIALEPGTKIRIFSGCFEYARAQYELVLEAPVGYTVVFRGDLFHSGVATQRQTIDYIVTYFAVV